MCLRQDSFRNCWNRRFLENQKTLHLALHLQLFQPLLPPFLFSGPVLKCHSWLFFFHTLGIPVNPVSFEIYPKSKYCSLLLLLLQQSKPLHLRVGYTGKQKDKQRETGLNVVASKYQNLDSMQSHILLTTSIEGNILFQLCIQPL